MEAVVKWGPCCFCAAQINEDEIDPCRVTVETSQGKWQAWYCHARCFKSRLVTSPELMGLFDPAHF